MLDEVAIRLGQEPDAGAALFELARRALVDHHVMAGVGEQARGGQPAERSPDDSDVHVRSRSGQGWPKVAIWSTVHSNSTRRSSIDGSRRPYGPGCCVYFVQILSRWAVTRWTLDRIVLARPRG